MAANEPSVPRRNDGLMLRRAIWAGVLLLGVCLGVALLLLGRAGQQPAASPLDPVAPAGPDVTWAAGAKQAPGISLADQDGKPISLAAYRGRPVIVTFIDPLCRGLCPLEAKVLNDVVARLPAAARPAILAVSASPYGNDRANLHLDMRKWHVVPQWHWAVGTKAALAAVWKRYQVQVLVRTRKVSGVTVHDVAHTEAAMLVDARGYQRGLYLWPFRAADVVRTLRGLAATS